MPIGKKTAQFMLGLAAALGSKAFAAGPPIETDDPGTAEVGHWEINLAYTRSKTPQFQSEEIPLADFNYGFSDNKQFKFEIPFVRESPRGQTSKSFWDHASIGMKWRFHDDGNDSNRASLAMSTYPTIELKTLDPDHNDNSALVSSYHLPLQIEEKFGDISFNQELAYRWLQGGRQGRAAYGLALSYRVRQDLVLLGELRGDMQTDGKADALRENLGFTWEWNATLSLLASCGQSFREADRGDKAHVFYGALQLHI